MSIPAILLIFFMLILVVSQFGNRLAARNSIVWWSVAAFIIVALVSPELLLPLVHAMGIQVVSNFVLASLVMFLFIQALELTSETTTQSRKVRQIVSTLAAENYVQKNRALHSIPSSLGGKPRVLIVLPCYNEEEALPSTIQDINRLNSLPISGTHEFFVCFVDDGSKDTTMEILETIVPSSYVSHSCNIGVSGVLMTGFAIGRRIGADFVIQCDSDGQHPVERIPSMVKEASEKKLDLLIGSRFCLPTGSASHISTTLARVTGIQVIRKMLQLFGKQATISDPTSGFRVYSKRAQNILSNQMPDEYPEPESIAILASKGAKIGETAVDMLPRSTGVSSIQGLKSFRFMVKVITALIGLRLRTLPMLNIR